MTLRYVSALTYCFQCTSLSSYRMFTDYLRSLPVSPNKVSELCLTCFCWRHHNCHDQNKEIDHLLILHFAMLIADQLLQTSEVILNVSISYFYNHFVNNASWLIKIFITLMVSIGYNWMLERTTISINYHKLFH